jgi:thiol:disulfide interchange protein DsbC
MIKRISAALIAAAALLASPASANEAAIKKALEAALPGITIEAVKKTPYLGLYEVQAAGGQLIYTDEKATYLFAGDIIEAKTRKNLTQERMQKLSKINFSDLPLNLAVKQVRGNGKRVIATFEDPRCGYCKQLARNLQGMNDLTIYTFVYPILGQESVNMSKAIWCASDRAKVWNELMLSSTNPSGKTDCDTSGIDQVVSLGQKLKVSATPTIFLANGERIPGAVTADRLEQAIAAAK